MEQTQKIKSYFFYISASIIIIAGLKFASQAVIILFLSIFIASILSPLMKFLERFKIPKFVALVIVMILAVLTLFFIANIINSSLKDFIDNLPFYEEKIKSLIIQSIGLLDNLGFSIDSKTVLESMDINGLFKLAAGMAGNIGIFLSKTLLVFIGVAFLLMESTIFERKLEIIFKRNKGALRHTRLFSHNIQKYFTIKTLTSMLTGFLIMSTLYLFEIDYPILWGFLGFILNFIPVVGSLIASFPALILALISHGFITAFWLAMIFVLINNIISNILEPKFMGGGLGLSPAVIFFSLIFWGWVLGPAGMFLAVPLTMTVKLACDASPKTVWIGMLLSNLSRKK